jgi:hypothetical protein
MQSPFVRLSILLAFHLALRRQHNPNLDPVDDGRAVPRIIATLPEVAHVLVRSRLDLLPRLSGGRTVDLVAGIASSSENLAAERGQRRDDERRKARRHGENADYIAHQCTYFPGGSASISLHGHKSTRAGNRQSEACSINGLLSETFPPASG